MTLTFIPTTRDQALAWARAGLVAGPVAAHQVSRTYVDAFGLDLESPDDQESAEFGALYLASVSCLLETPQRVVLVADTAAEWVPVSGAEAEFGLGRLQEVDWADVTSFYVDDAAAVPAVSAAHEAVRGSSLASAWEDDRVIALLSEHTLLWHNVAELAHLQ